MKTRAVCQIPDAGTLVLEFPDAQLQELDCEAFELGLKHRESLQQVTLAGDRQPTRDIQLLTEGAIGTGSRFRGEYDRIGTMEYEILELDRPHHVLVRGKSKSFEWVSTFDFSERGAGTHVVGTMDPQPKGLLGLLKPILETLMKGQMLKGMGSLKRTLESKPAAT